MLTRRGTIEEEPFHVEPSSPSGMFHVEPLGKAWRTTHPS